MDARPSLRELFAELSRADGADPTELLHAAGYGDVPEPLVAAAIANYAGTAPLEVAEHLSPFAVAHGPVPAADVDDPTSTHHGLSLLASAPVVDAHPVDLHVVDLPVSDEPGPHADLAVDLDPSTLDDPSAHPGDVDPAGVDGLDSDSGPSDHPGPGVEPHPALGGFGVGHDGPGDEARTDDGTTDDGTAGHHGDTFPTQGHVQDVEAYDEDVSHHDPDALSDDPSLLDDDHPDPADELDDDTHHHGV